METYYNGMIEKDTSVVSEELNSVETKFSCIISSRNCLFQKDLIVWKHVISDNYGRTSKRVSEELNSVETVSCDWFFLCLTPVSEEALVIGE